MKTYTSTLLNYFFKSSFLSRVGILLGWTFFCLIEVTGTGHSSLIRPLPAKLPTDLAIFKTVLTNVSSQKELGFSSEQIDQKFFDKFCKTNQISGSFEDRVKTITDFVASVSTEHTGFTDLVETNSRQADTKSLLPLPEEAYLKFPELTVTTTASSGPGSLREALNQANQSGGRRRIVFRLSPSDPNFDAHRGVWQISVTQRLYILSDLILVDGLSQKEFWGDTNPNGPEIELFERFDGSYDQFLNSHPYTFTYTLFFIYSAHQNWIRGFSFLTKPAPPLNGSTLQSGGVGISCMASQSDVKMASGNRVSDNYIGVSSDGRLFSGNNMLLGIMLSEGTYNSLIENNLIGTPGPAIWLVGSGNPNNNYNNVIRGNRLGTTQSGREALPIMTRLTGRAGPWPQISFFMYPENVLITDNIIAGTRGGGIGNPDLFGNRNAGNIIVSKNYIGISPEGHKLMALLSDSALNSTSQTDNGQFAFGIYVNQSDKIVDNFIGNFGLGGVFIHNWSGSGINSQPTLIESNQISNSPLGIQVCGLSKGVTVLSQNKIENCSKAGVVVCRRFLDLTSIYLTEDESFYLTKNVVLTQNQFIQIEGPGICLVDSVHDVLNGTYTPNTRSERTMDGPNLFQPSPQIKHAAYQADGSIKVTGTAALSGYLELYASVRPSQAESDLSFQAYGFGRYLQSFPVEAGSFEIRVPSFGALSSSLSGKDQGQEVQYVTATLTSNNQTSEFGRTVTVVPFEETSDTDRVSPLVAVTYPANTSGGDLVFESGAANQVTVEWASSDNIGISQHSLILTGVRDGVAFTEFIATGLPGSAQEFMTTFGVNDEFDQGQFTVIAIDQAGNSGRGVSGNFRVVAPVVADTEPPQITHVSYSKNKIRRGQDIELTVSWEVTDNQEIAVQELWLLENNIPQIPIVTGLTGTDRTFRWILPEGLSKTKAGHIELRVRDQSGNISTQVGPVLKIK